MSEPITLFEKEQHIVAMAVRGLMVAAKDISDLYDDGYSQPLLRLEYEDIEVTHIFLTRLLQRMKEPS